MIILIEFCYVILLGPQVLFFTDLGSGQIGAWDWGGWLRRQRKNEGG